MKIAALVFMSISMVSDSLPQQIILGLIGAGLVVYTELKSIKPADNE